MPDFRSRFFNFFQLWRPDPASRNMLPASVWFQDIVHVPQAEQSGEIRDFPKAIFNSETNIPDLVEKALKNCLNLRSCTWTRDGSLSSEILSSLAQITTLTELEFNGRSQGQYDPKLLRQFSGLAKVSVIMPSSTVINHLSGMLAAHGASLRHLTFICKVILAVFSVGRNQLTLSVA